MQPFNEYITGSTESVSREELHRLISHHEWFTTARRARVLLTGESDPALALPAMFRPTIPPGNGKRKISANEPQHVSAADEIIARFLEQGGYRITPNDDADVEVAVTEEKFEDADGELVTEELAGIYLAQGLIVEAKEIYRKLSLLNPEKSIYFADIISKIDAEKTNN